MLPTQEMRVLNSYQVQAFSCIFPQLCRLTLTNFVHHSHLQQHPEEVGEDSLGAGAWRSIRVTQVVEPENEKIYWKSVNICRHLLENLAFKELFFYKIPRLHVGDTAGEGEHDDQECDEEPEDRSDLIYIRSNKFIYWHQHVLQHDSDAEDDGSKVFWHDSCLDALQYGQSEGDAPEYSTRSLHCSNVPVGVDQDILQHAYGETNQEETVSDDVVVVPEGEVALLEPPDAWVGLFKTPEEESCSNVTKKVRSDEDGEGSIKPVYCWCWGFVDIAEDQGYEDAIRESRVNCPIKRDSPFFTEPWDHVRISVRSVFVGEDTRVEEGIEKEKKVARDLFENMKKPREYGHVNPERIRIWMMFILHFCLT